MMQILTKMNTHEFSVWLHGWTELNGGERPTEAQWKMILEHLDLCFNKVTKPLEKEKVLPIDFKKVDEVEKALKRVLELSKGEEIIPGITSPSIPPFTYSQPGTGERPFPY